VVEVKNIVVVNAVLVPAVEEILVVVVVVLVVNVDLFLSQKCNEAITCQ
jgi:hypothetical protein